MRIRLGLDLDGQHGELPRNELDALTTGPLGMLNVLETQLGLLRNEAGQAERVLQYREVLRRLDAPTRFFHASFAVDELGTALTLLGWRDQWHLHGWSVERVGYLQGCASIRLRDMGDIESALAGSLAPCIGERLRSVAKSMADTSPRIQLVTLSEPIHAWPKAWQEVLARLTVAMDEAGSAASSASLLGEIQSAMQEMQRSAKPPLLRWRDDGSVQVVQAETQLLAGRWLGEVLEASGNSCLLVAPRPGLLDDILSATHLPRQGFRELSAFRPALQVVPLALGQLWAPLDLFGLLKFLTHPICPVPGVARTRLAEMLASSPGIGGGPAWEKTLNNIELACQETGYDWAIARTHIETWVEHERHDPVTGVPIAVVVDRLGMLSNFFQGRLKLAEGAHRAAFGSGQSQALACQSALKALALQGETHISRQQLETLVDQATAQGVGNPMLRAEVGAARSVSRPAAAIDPAEHVIWWQLEAPVLPGAYPWSADERSALADAGVQLPPVDELLEREAASWQCPVLAASRRLTLVLPPPGGEEHPLWLLIKSMFDKDHQPPVLALESCLSDPVRPAQDFRPLPGRKRWWNLPPGSLPKREQESFSSLESFLFNPYQWVLTYPAALRPSSILDVSDGFLLYGTLAHHLVERYVEREDVLSMSDSEFDSWFAPAFNQLIGCEGAVLLMPGRREDLTAFRRQLQSALRQLRQQLKSAGVVKVESECELDGCFVGGRIAGYGDLLLTKQDGSQAIVDMKWAGGKKYPAKLQENRHLQLAIYGELQRQKTGRWPHLAYFIICSGELIATDRAFFPDARVIWKKKELEDEGTAHLWQRFVKTWQWRRTQFDQGEVEVVVSLPEDSDVPEDGMALELLNQAYNNYLALAGWGEDA